MIKFFRLRHAGQPKGSVVLVAEDEQAGMLLRWVPDTGLWHRAADLEPDYLFGDEGGTYEPITPAQAASLLDKVQRFDQRRLTGRRVLARFKSLPAAAQRTNAEVGLSSKLTGKRPTMAAGLPMLLDKARRHGGWRTVNIYPSESGSSAARQLASTLNRTGLPELPASRRVEAKHVREGDHVAVKARLT